MATERLAPDALLVQTGLTGAVTAIDEDPDSADASWLTTSNNTATTCRVSFPTPTGPPTTGVNGQEFRLLLRKTNHSTNPTYTVDLYENGSLVTNLIGATTLSSTTGVVVSAPWNAASLGTANGSLVEVQVTGTPGGGSPGNRASVEVGAIEWNVTYTPAATFKDAAVTFAGTGTATTVWQRVRTRVAAFTGAGTLTTAFQRVRVRVASWIGTGTFTVTPESGATYKDAAVSFAGAGATSTAWQRVRTRVAAWTGAGTATVAWARLRNRVATWVGGSTFAASRQRIRTQTLALAGAGAFAVAPENPDPPAGNGNGYSPGLRPVQVRRIPTSKSRRVTVRGITAHRW